MSDEKKSEDFVNVTDCLETIGVCKSMKNLLFIVMFLCIIGLGACFWLTDLGMVNYPGLEKEVKVEVVEDEIVVETPEPNSVAAQVAKAVEKVTADSNVILVDTAAKEVEKEAEVSAANFRIDFIYVAKGVRIFNFVLVLSAVLYSLTLLFCLKVSLVGRLGGMNHITRAFFGSLFVLVFIFPWQKYLGPITIGAIYLPVDLKDAIGGKESMSLFGVGLYYIRFVLWWAIVLILLICAQRRSAKWSNATLKRLGIE